VRRSEVSDLKLVTGPLLLFAMYIDYPFVHRTWVKGFHWLLMELLRCCGIGQAFTWQ